MTRPRLLDLFCGAGGAAMGYYRAGFDVVGVDIKPQPRYPFEFHQGDALEYCAAHGAEFDAIHASPPCQAYSSLKTMPTAKPHPELVDPTRDLLRKIDKPWIIENVEGAPLVIGPPALFWDNMGIMLCGTMFGLATDDFELRRHRLFEASIPLVQPRCKHSDKPVVGFYGDHARLRRRRPGMKNRGHDITGQDKMRLVDALMGIDWMEWSESNQAIPPAYTEYIGHQLLAAMEAL